MAEKERIAKWVYNQVSNLLSLFDAKSFKDEATSDPVVTIDLGKEIPGFAELPEYLRFHIQFGIRQKASDPNAAKELDPKNKLNGIKLSLQAWKEVTFKKAGGGERGPSVSIKNLISIAKNKSNLEFIKEAYGKDFSEDTQKAFDEKLTSFSKK